MGLNKFSIPYGKQNITDEDISAVIETLKSSHLTQGPRIPELENNFLNYIGAKYSIAVSNGTTALHLCSLAIGLSKGDIVLTTPLSFVATSNSVLYTGADVEFVDIDPDTFNIDLDKLEQRLLENPHRNYKAIYAVSFAGYPLNTEELSRLCKKYSLRLVEDSCHAIGGEFIDSEGRSVKAGSSIYSDLSVFSFHPVKHIAAGEGGMITTNNKDLYNEINLLKTHGITKDSEKFNSLHSEGWYYEMQQLGYNYRISDIQATLANSQLKRINENIKQRQDIASFYDKELSHLPITLPKRDKSVTHGFHLYVIQVPKREELYNYLKERGIYAQVHYIPIHMQPYYISRYGIQQFPVCENYYTKCLSLPMYHSLKENELNYVVSCISDFFKQK